MKILYITLAFLQLVTKPAIAQEQNIEFLEKFIILEATENGEDITRHLLAEEAFLSLYEIPGKESVYFANVWPREKTMSHGIVYGAELKEFPETEKAYGGVELTFYWKYQNTYNEDSGTGKVMIRKIYKPQGIYFEAIIVAENLDLLIYKGHVEGTLK